MKWYEAHDGIYSTHTRARRNGLHVSPSRQRIVGLVGGIVLVEGKSIHKQDFFGENTLGHSIEPPNIHIQRNANV